MLYNIIIDSKHFRVKVLVAGSCGIPARSVSFIGRRETWSSNLCCDKNSGSIRATYGPHSSSWNYTQYQWGKGILAKLILVFILQIIFNHNNIRIYYHLCDNLCLHVNFFYVTQKIYIVIALMLKYISNYQNICSLMTQKLLNYLLNHLQCMLLKNDYLLVSAHTFMQGVCVC